MFVEGAFLRGFVGMGTVPASALLVDWGHASVLILIVLALCCGFLWVLSRSATLAARSASSVTSSHSKRTRRGSRTSPTNRRTPFGTAAAEIPVRST